MAEADRPDGRHQPQQAQRPAGAPLRVLVTGASGRIGQAIAARLTQAGHAVQGLDRRPSAAVQHLGDLADPALLARALHGVQAVVHTAALHAPQVGQVAEAEFWRINLAGTQRLWAAALAAGVQRWVFTSTTALYGHSGNPDGGAAWVTEATPPQPRSVYHHSKLAAEQWLADAARAAGAPRLRILRMSRCFPEAAPLMAVYRLHRGVDARDVARAHALALQDGGPATATWVISGATPFQPQDAQALWQDAPAVLAARAPDLVAWMARRGWPLPARIDRVYVPALAAQQLGWVAQHGPAEVLQQLDHRSTEVLAPPAGSAG